MAEFADGALSQDQAAIATKAPAYLDKWFAEVATAATVAQLRVMVRGARPAPAPCDEPEESLAGWFDDEGRYQLRGDLDADHGRIVDAALTEARDALFHPGQPKVSWADALVEIARRSLDGAPEQRRERFRVNWFIDPDRSGPGPVHRRPRRPGLAARPVAVRRHRVPGVHRQRPAGERRPHPIPGARPHPPARAATGPKVSGAVVHSDPLVAGPSHHPRPASRPDRHVEPGRAVPGAATGSTTVGCSASPATLTTPTGSPSPTATAR